MSTRAQLYADLVRRRCTPQARQWWEAVLTLNPAFSPGAEFLRAYSKAARMLGNASLEVEHEEVAADVMAWLLPFQQRPVHELGRTALVLRAFEVWPPEEPVKFIDELFVRGDNAEREALLRTLPMLPDAGRFSVTAVEACRTNVLTVFDAIACENPYPARYFSELHFNQLVMKALFIGVSLRRIVCLSERITPGLRRMVRDHVKERTVADRPVHADTKLILNPLVTSGIR